MSERWIVIPNWDRFQHYKDRDPPWIKLHRSLASDPAWLALSGHRRGLLISLWLEYATSNRRLRDDTLTITRRIGLRATRADIDALAQAGFIKISASKPLATPLAKRYARGRGEDSKESSPTGAQSKKGSRRKPGNADDNGAPSRHQPVPATGTYNRCPHCGITVAAPTTLADHVHNQHER